MVTKFREGEVYYRLTFPDAELLYPKVESFVFVGKNLAGDDKEDVWYFQFADSYAKFGSVLKGPSGDRRVSCVGANELPDMLNLNGLIRELQKAGTRRCAQRKP